MRTGWILSAATAFVLLGVSVAAFLNPVWVGFEQDRVGSASLVGACPALVRTFTNEILRELVVGGAFDDIKVAEGNGSTCAGATTSSVELAPGEAAHMRDVRGVFAGFALLVLASVVLVALTWRRSRGTDRAAWWRAVRRGAAALAIVVAALGAVALVAFDAAFELFHRLFFASGTYSFDPATSRLVQLFPDQFWSETTLAVGLVAVVLSIVTWGLATRRLAAAGRLTEATSTARLRVGEEGAG